MTEPNVRPYEGELTYTLPLYKELNKGCSTFFLRNKLPILLFLFLTSLVSFGYAVVLRDTQSLSYFLFLNLGIFWGSRLFVSFMNRNGGKDYQRMLSNNGGKPRHCVYHFLSDGIHLTDTNSGGITVFPYAQVRKVYETENLVCIVLEHQRVMAVDKRTLSGGPVSAFVEKLLLFSPNAKKKKLSSLTPGKVIQGITIVLSIAYLLLAIWCSAPVTRMREASRTIQPDMSYRQMAQALEPYGIHDIPDSVFDELEEMDAAYSDFYTPSTSDRCLSLLCWAGYGSYDEETWQWTPAECGVFWFDTEAFGLDTMYTDLLRGIRALDSETLCFADFHEDISDVDLEAGTGTQSVSFSWNGQHHTLTAKVDYDWYDLSVLTELNDLIREETGGRQLYFAWDQGQGFLVFFGDAQWAKDFSAATGILLYRSPYSTGALF